MFSRIVGNDIHDIHMRRLFTGAEMGGIKLTDRPDGLYLEITVDPAWAAKSGGPPVTTDSLGKAEIPGLPYEQPDGRPFRLDRDYLGNPRNAQSPFPGPFELAGAGKHELKVWPVAPEIDP